MPGRWVQRGRSNAGNREKLSAAENGWSGYRRAPGASGSGSELFIAVLRFFRCMAIERKPRRLYSVPARVHCFVRLCFTCFFFTI